ncbi:hypothetical protein P4S68_06795 [Pseudoalteromonas sp. Hal099]
MMVLKLAFGSAAKFVCSDLFTTFENLNTSAFGFASSKLFLPSHNLALLDSAT